MKVKDPTGRLAKCALQLQHCNSQMIHCSVSSNGNSDALSRWNYTKSDASVSSMPYLSVSLAAIDHPCNLPSSLISH